MSLHPSPAPASSHTSVGLDSGQPASTSVRLGDLLATCRRLATKFLRNPRWGVMFTLGRFRFVSAAVVFFHRSRIVRPTAGLHTLFPFLDFDTALLNMRRDGIHAGVNLDPETVAQITRFAYSTECYWPTDPSLRFLYANRADAERRCGKAILLGRYFDIEERCESRHACGGVSSATRRPLTGSRPIRDSITTCMITAVSRSSSISLTLMSSVARTYMSGEAIRTNLCVSCWATPGNPRTKTSSSITARTTCSRFAAAPALASPPIRSDITGAYLPCAAAG